MATTTSSLDDFDRSFDYWSRGGGGDTTTVSSSSHRSSSGGGEDQHDDDDGAAATMQWNQRPSPMNSRRRIPNASIDGSSSTSPVSSSGRGSQRDGEPERELLEYTVTNARESSSGDDDDDDDDDDDCYSEEEGGAFQQQDVYNNSKPTVRSVLADKKKKWLLRKREQRSAATSRQQHGAGAATDDANVEILIREQLSAVYDDVSPDPSCHIEGSISMMIPQEVSTSTATTTTPFCLTLRDVLGQLDRVDPNDDVCQNVSDRVSRQGLHRLDRVLRVRMPNDGHGDGHPDDMVRLATYHSTIRPVPLLVKSRVQVSQSISRAGFKIRANPSNEYTLTNMVIMLAVPPYVKGSTARMSRPGGSWNEMKRVISWDVNRLEPGEAMEVQLQFESMDGTWDREPKFPVLVRADCPRLFTSLEVRSDYTDGLSRLVSANVATSARVLHRKV